MQKISFDAGRKIGKHPLASRLFCMVEPVLPLKRLGRSAQCVAFIHPRPSYDPHILVVPTTPIPALANKGLVVNGKALVLWEMIRLAREVIAERSEPNWQMIVNGGARQEIGQVHGHLVRARELEISSVQFELPDPAADIAPWDGLFADLDAVATRPYSGYSVVFRVSKHGPVNAWITA